MVLNHCNVGCVGTVTTNCEVGMSSQAVTTNCNVGMSSLAVTTNCNVGMSSQAVTTNHCNVGCVGTHEL